MWKYVSYNRDGGKAREENTCERVRQLYKHTHHEESVGAVGRHTALHTQIGPFVEIKRNDCTIRRRTWPGNEVDLDRLFSAVGAVQGAYCLAAHCFLYL